jgi:hypothetical protein
LLRAATATELFGRLEDEVQRARFAQTPRGGGPGQCAGGSRQHRRVPIMTAGMHPAGALARPRQAGGLR